MAILIIKQSVDTIEKVHTELYIINEKRFNNSKQY